MMVGDYVLSFNKQTCELREPFLLSKVFRLMLDGLPYLYDNSLRNKSTNQDVRAFVAERHHSELLFLRLPVPVTQGSTARDALLTWREPWLRRGHDFWVAFESPLGPNLDSQLHNTHHSLTSLKDL